LNLIFHLKNKIFSNFFFLFLEENCAKFMMQKEKSRKFCIYMVKMAAKSSLVILFALVIHTAPTVYTARIGQPGQDTQNKTARTGEAEQERQNRRGRTGEAEQERQNRRGRTGEAEQERQNREARTGRNMTGRTGKAEHNGKTEKDRRKRT
jgi:hypothetical protein